MHYYKRVKHLKFFKITRSRFFSMECYFKDSSSLITGKLPKGLADKVLSTANDKIMQKRPSGG